MTIPPFNHAPPARLARPCGAFTLVELLTVLGVLGILAALLFPVLAEARRAALGAACTSNLRHFAIASACYSADNGGRLPGFRAWLAAPEADFQTGLLFPYLKSRQAYCCPTERSEIARRGPPGLTGARVRNFSYAMNCGVCHARSLERFVAPSLTAFFLEADMALTDYSGLAGPAQAARGLAVRHRGQGHVLYADLHLSRLSRPAYESEASMKRFWFATEDTTGSHGQSLWP